MLSRRRFLSQSLLMTILPLFTASCGNDSFFAGRLSTALSRIVTRHRALIRESANMLANSIIARNRCFIRTGDSALLACLTENTLRLPRMFTPLLSTEMAATVHSGDTIFAMTDDDITATARTNGARVIMLGGPDTQAQSTDLHIPLTDTKQSPAVQSILAASLLQAIAAEAYRRSSGIGLTSEINIVATADFTGILNERLHALTDMSAAFIRAAKDIAASAAHSGRTLIYAHPGALIIDVKKNLPKNAVLVPRNELLTNGLAEHDTLICVTLDPAAPSDMLLLRTLDMHTRHIAICPIDSDDNGGFRLYNSASHAFDNMSPEESGILSFDYGEQKYLSTGPLMNTVILLSLFDSASI